MTVETIEHVRSMFIAAGTRENQNVVIAAILFDSVRGRVHAICGERMTLLLGVGEERVANVVEALRRVRSVGVDGPTHGNTGRAPANRTDSDLEAAIAAHFRQWTKFVPEVDAQGRTYAKFISWDMNSTAKLANNFNLERAGHEGRKGPSLHVYRRIVQAVMQKEGVSCARSAAAAHSAGAKSVLDTPV